jgi:hypothetical protein
MDEDYSVIREALLALLCVGDEIYYVFQGIGNRYHVRLCTIDKILNEDQIVINSGNLGFMTIQYTELVDVYNGKPYIWSACHIRDFNGRLEKLSEIIKSEDTLFEFF